MVWCWASLAMSHLRELGRLTCVQCFLHPPLTHLTPFPPWTFPYSPTLLLRYLFCSSDGLYLPKCRQRDT